MTERLHFHFSLSCIRERNGNTIQCSCLENPRDGGAWWAAISGVAQSRTRLKRLSSSSNNYLLQSFPDRSVGKECACNAGDLRLIPGLGRSAGEGIGYPLQYSWASLVAQLVKNLPANFLSHQQSFNFRNEENEAQILYNLANKKSKE